MLSPEEKRLRHQRAKQHRTFHQRAKQESRRRRGPQRVNKKKVVPARSSGATLVACPAVLDFEAAPLESTAFFDDLEKTLTKSKVGVIVDHRPLENLSPAAALVLIAHLFRIHRRKPDLPLFVYIPTRAEPRDLLGLIGYYDYFKKVAWERPQSAKRHYLAIKRGELVMQEYAQELCAHLQTHGKLSTQKFYAALVEGMANATEWGYGQKESGYRTWWLLGYRDEITKEMAYCFYDQGVGIPISIRTRFLDMLPGLRPSGSELIEIAVREGRYSRTKNKGRGSGLPTLLSFVEEGTDGQLLIFSNESRCVFKHGEKTRKDDYNIGLRGTLISWSFSPP